VFEGRTAHVTGGSGIGKAITAALLERGSNVVVPEISPENAQTAADELSGGAGSRSSRVQ
jgi:3-oxoacyl-[acyl-carrier protein] reductase